MITLVAAGDVEWSGAKFDYERWSRELIFQDPGDASSSGKSWLIPRVVSPQTRDSLVRECPGAMQRYIEACSQQERAMGRIHEHFARKELHGLTFASAREWACHPFLKVAEVFRGADIAFVNLETPLSDNAPRVGAFRTPTAFTEGLKYAGIELVSIANNHVLDAQVQGLIDTFDALDAAGIHHLGAGRDLCGSRKPYVVERKGIRIAFLAYTQHENSGGFATSSRPGVAPMDPLLIKEDIARVRERVDHVVLSLHWDNYALDEAERFEVHPQAVAFAHEMIDAGASAILGHHSHVPRAVEYYKGRPILYSMAHLIFSSGHPSWVDNYIARLHIAKESMPSVEILPTAGRMKDLSQPYLLEGERALEMLVHLQSISKGLGGKLSVEGNRGLLTA